MTLEEVKTAVEIVAYLVAIAGGLFALWTYRDNQAAERSRWASSLHEKFYERPDYKGIRRDLDCSKDSQEVAALVAREPPEFTDYLNFFEHVAYLVKCGQIAKRDAEAYFDYYLSCLKRHPVVMRYIQDNAHGYEELAKFLS